MSVAAAMANKFLNPLATECGSDTTVGYPSPSDTEATFETAYENKRALHRNPNLVQIEEDLKGDSD